MRRPWPATTIYYLREAFGAFNSGLIFTSIWTFYYNVLNLSLVQISWLYIIITVTGFLMEIPTGIIADSYSRRWSVIIGSFLIGVCYVLGGSFPVYAIVLVGGFIEAIGDTCISGALEAWITDEVGSDEIGKVFVRSHQFSVPMHWFGVGLSIIIAALLNYQAAIILGGVLWIVIALILVVWMPETRVIQRSLDRSSISKHLQMAWETARTSFSTIRKTKILIRIFIAGFFATAIMDSFYRFSRLHFLHGFTLPTINLPIIGPLKENVWFGILDVIQSSCILIGMLLLRRYVDMNRRLTVIRLLINFYGVIVCGLLIFATGSSLTLIMIAWLLINVLYAVAQPLIQTWLNQSIESSSRATVLSMQSQFNMVGMLTLSSALSVLGDRFGVPVGLIVASTFGLPIIWVYFQSHREEARTDGRTQQAPPP